MNATSIAMKLTGLVVAGGILLILFKRIKILKKYGFESILYVLLISILVSLPTLLLLFEFSFSGIYVLIMAQGFIILMGILHIVSSPFMVPWFKSQPFKMQVLFILCILFLGYFFSNLSFTYLVEPPLKLVWYLSLLWFFVPVLLNETIIRLSEVPPKLFTQWYYPVNETIDDPSDEELENPIVISFVFNKNENTREMTTFRAKAPVGMKFSRLFYFFINDYNSRHPESQISYVDLNKEPNGWVFMKVRSRLFRWFEVVDPGGSIWSNNIRENDVMICKRMEKNIQSN
jgi:hypothetical protein